MVIIFFFHCVFFKLEGVCSLSRYLLPICIISEHILGTLAEIGPIHWVGVQTFDCGAAMKVNGDGHLEGARSFLCYSTQICIIPGYFLGKLAEIGPINCTNLAAEQPCR